MNNIQKLFAEKIEIFSPVEFSKVSVLTGIVKITLKVRINPEARRFFYENISLSIKDIPRMRSLENFQQVRSTANTSRLSLSAALFVEICQ